jgi:hypothetical protein
MFNRAIASLSVIALLFLLGLTHSRAEEAPDTAVVKALDGARVTLEEGLRMSEAVGKPISAKFEIENGRLQLSVYAMANDEYREIVIAPDTGVLMSAQKISDAEDLAAAATQMRAIKDARVPLRRAVEQATSKLTGSRGVSVDPELRDGRPVAKVALLRAGTLTTVDEDIR